MKGAHAGTGVAATTALAWASVFIMRCYRP